MTCGTHPDIHFAGIAISEEAFDGVEDAPAGDHVILVGVVFDVLDTRGGFDGGCGIDRGIVEVGSRGAEGVDFLVWPSESE